MSVNVSDNTYKRINNTYDDLFFFFFELKHPGNVNLWNIFTAFAVSLSGWKLNSTKR